LREFSFIIFIKEDVSMKERIQRGGRFLSGMVMPNIGAFIAWGLITALFIPTGWIPNETLANIVGDMLRFLLPILIGYQGGKMVGGDRGAVAGAVATIGVVIGGVIPDTGATVPMFLGAMIAGPVGGKLMKTIDKALEGRIRAGFEMLVNNYTAGILGAILAVIFYLVIGPVCVAINVALGAGVKFFVDAGLLPLSAILVEPAKVLFLNNAINHGIFTPLGAQQAAELGKSIFYMIESNPGPGLGLLLAYWIFGKGSAKSSAPGAVIIHFLGGIHEIYFPYVLMNPILILAPMAGNAVSIFILNAMGGGAIGPPSPGSIFAQLAMTPPDGFLPNILAIVLSTAVSLAVAIPLLKFFGKDDLALEDAQAKTKQMKAESKGQLAPGAAAAPVAVDMATVTKIAFACDAGMGSSAMGATTLRKKIKAAGIEGVEVVHTPVSEIAPDIQIIVTHKELQARAAAAATGARVLAITNFMAAPEYDTLVDELLAARKPVGVSE
jgi:PTS system mannitol-specific IIC component